MQLLLRLYMNPGDGDDDSGEEEDGLCPEERLVQSVRDCLHKANIGPEFYQLIPVIAACENGPHLDVYGAGSCADIRDHLRPLRSSMTIALISGFPEFLPKTN